MQDNNGGGAIYADGGTTLTIYNSMLSSNTAAVSGGIICVTLELLAFNIYHISYTQLHP